MSRPYEREDEGTTHDQPASVTMRIRRPDGSTAPLDAVAAEDGDVDAAARNELQQRLIVADRLAAVGTLAAGAAHEVNNPLTYAMLNVEHVTRKLRALMASDPLLSSRGVGRSMNDLIDSLAHATQGLERVREIMRNLLTFARGNVEARTLVDVRSVVESSIQMALHEIQHRARLVRELREVPPVEANEARLGQVILNLLVNAAQAIPEGDSRQHEVRVETSTDGAGNVIVQVTDTGLGISPDLLPHIFDPFVSSKAGALGAGLGLSVSHGTVKSLGGEIHVTSGIGNGTSFRVVLPAARGWRTMNAPTPGPISQHLSRVLVIDDDPLVGRSIARTLEEEGTVHVLSSGREALEKLASGERYDLILCDLMMPEMSGMDLYGELLRLAPDALGRIVFMTGGAFTPRARAFIESIGNRCIDKPIDANEVRGLARSSARARSASRMVPRG